MRLVVVGPRRRGVGGRPARRHLRRRDLVGDGRRDELVERAAVREARANEALVRGVFEKAAHQIGHARHKLPHWGIHPQPHPQPTDGRVNGFGHAVEHLNLVGRVRDADALRVLNRIRERSQIVGAEGGADFAVMIVEQAHAPLVIRVRLRLVLEDGHGPTLGARRDRLRIPIRPFDEADADRLRPRRRPRDDAREVVVAIAQVRLDDDARVERAELRLVE